MGSYDEAIHAINKARLDLLEETMQELISALAQVHAPDGFSNSGFRSIEERFTEQAHVIRQSVPSHIHY